MSEQDRGVSSAEKDDSPFTLTERDKWAYDLGHASGVLNCRRPHQDSGTHWYSEYVAARDYLSDLVEELHGYGDEFEGSSEPGSKHDRVVHALNQADAYLAGDIKAVRLESAVRAGAVLNPDDLRMPDATEEEADDMAGEAVWRCPKCNGTGFIVSTQGARKCISCKVEMQFMVALCDLCELPLSDHGKDGCHDARAVNRATDVALSESNDHRDEKKASSTSEVPASTKLDVPTGSGPEGHGAANSAHPAPVRSPSSDPGKTDGAWYVPCREGKHVQCPQGHIDGHADCACPCHIGYDLGHRAGYGIGRYDEKHGQDDLYWLSRPAPESGASAWHEYDSNPIDAEARMKKAAAVDAGDSARIDHIADIIVANVGGYGGTGIPAHAPDAAKEILAYLAGHSAAGTPWELLDGFNVAVSLLNEVLPSLECAVDPAGCEAADVDPTNYCTACMVGQFVTYRVPYVRASVPGTGASA